MSGYFIWAAPFQRWTPDKGWALQSRSFVVGELTQFLLLRPTGATEVMGVRFRPGGAYRFLTLPLSDLTDSMFATEEWTWRRSRAE